MVNRFNGGVVAAPGVCEPVDEDLLKLAQETAAEYERAMERLEINTAIKGVWALIGRANKYIDETGPWALAKDPAKKGRLNTVLYNLAEVLRIVAILISPFMPNTTPRIWKQLGLAGDPAALKLDDAQRWGLLPAGTVMAAPEALFPRIEEKEDTPVDDEAKKAAADEPAAQAAPILPEVSIEEFAKMDFRTARVLACEKVEKADKLLKLTVDIGGEVRTIISGIAMHYTPEDLVGKDVVMIVNLKPAKIRGIDSRGMVLAAVGGEKLALVTAPGMAPGSKVR
jgi:methionyl-tRNA synthetase